jgi:hypothetical protein
MVGSRLAIDVLLCGHNSVAKAPDLRTESRSWKEFNSCRVPAALKNLLIAVTAAESITRLRDWASGRCLNAEAAGIYSRNPNAVPKQRRQIRRDDPSNN